MSQNHATKLTHAPAYPHSGIEIMRQLKQALDLAESNSGDVLLQKTFGTLIGAPKSTVHDWMYTERAETIKRFLCGLERLSEKDRTALLKQLCRPCPRLDDIAIAHDAAALNGLKAILRQPKGVTFIASSSDDIRTFLLTAMGNFVAPDSRLAGLDAHAPKNFVPIPGVHYLTETCATAELNQIVARLWPEFSKPPARYMFFNRIWFALHARGKGFYRLAKKAHVVIADEFVPTDIELEFGCRVDIVRAEILRPSRLRISFEAR